MYKVEGDNSGNGSIDAIEKSLDETDGSGILSLGGSSVGKDRDVGGLSQSLCR